MSRSFDVFAIGGSGLVSVPVTNLTPVGGKKSSGFVLESLKHDGDYAIVAPQGEGLIVHPLRGSNRHPQALALNGACHIDDLSLIVVPKAGAAKSESSEFRSLQNVLTQMAEPQNTERALTQVLSDIMTFAQHEKGLVISKNLSGQFEILVSRNLDADQAWISENLVQSVLQTKKPAFVHNLIGSAYHSSQSLVATGFLSVFCWPLVVQGVSLGVLLTGSRRPHSGLSADQSLRIETFVHLAAMLTSFRLREMSLQREISQLRAKNNDGPFETQSPKLKSTCDLARQVADSDLAVMVQGETGVGKEVMARWLHEQSSRKSGPFIAVNCGAIPGELLESLLFGHKKGAFTHAFNDQIGKIQQAHGGTLFLDEIGDLPPALQPKLLRVLNDKMVEPLGSQRATQVDVRLIAATHKPLKELVAQKQFREDLFYRVAELTLWIPPLRERPADVLLIAQQFLRELGGDKTFSEDAREWLLAQTWKGNVRELKSVIKRALVLSGSSGIKRQHFLMGSEEPQLVAEEKIWLGADNLEKAKQVFVFNKIQQALEMTGGNRTKAAQLLGVTPRTLFRYLEDDMKGLSQ